MPLSLGVRCGGDWSVVDALPPLLRPNQPSPFLSVKNSQPGVGFLDKMPWAVWETAPSKGSSPASAKMVPFREMDDHKILVAWGSLAVTEEEDDEADDDGLAPGRDEGDDAMID